LLITKRGSLRVVAFLLYWLALLCCSSFSMARSL